MIDKDMLNIIKQHTESLPKVVTLVINKGEHDTRQELLDFLTEITSVSKNIQLEERELALRSPVSFTLEVEGNATGIVFSGIPSGHEFTSLVLAILQAGGTALKLDEGIQKLIKKVKQPLNFEVFVSLSCHNCPDVVQALNQFSLLNSNISSEMIEGGLFQDEIEKRNIQGVPSVYLNGESFTNGKVDTAKLIEKLMSLYPEMTESGNNETMPLQDVTIIGGGPAGVAAAIYAARKGLAVTIVADRIGGQVQDTMGIENFIGTRETTGPKLSANLSEHIKAYNITCKENISVESVEEGDKKHTLKLKTGETIESKTVIIASGAKWRELGVPGEKENLGNGVAYCPHCDGPFFKGKHVAVIGGGNSGVEAAIDLAGIVRHVTVIEYDHALRADKVLIEAAENRSNIDIITSAQTTEIKANDGKVTALNYQDRTNSENKTIELDGVFVQIGLLPNTGFLGDLLAKNKMGEIEINAKCETNIPGIFACGDCTTVPYKQIIISMGEGAKASLAAFDYLIRQ